MPFTNKVADSAKDESTISLQMVSNGDKFESDDVKLLKVNKKEGSFA